MYSSASATFSGCCPRPVAGALLEEYKRRRVPLALYALFVGYACEAAALIVATNTLYESRKLHYAVSKQLGGGGCQMLLDLPANHGKQARGCLHPNQRRLQCLAVLGLQQLVTWSIVGAHCCPMYACSLQTVGNKVVAWVAGMSFRTTDPVRIPFPCCAAPPCTCSLLCCASFHLLLCVHVQDCYSDAEASRLATNPTTLSMALIWTTWSFFGAVMLLMLLLYNLYPDQNLDGWVGRCGAEPGDGGAGGGGGGMLGAAREQRHATPCNFPWPHLIALCNNTPACSTGKYA